MKIYRLAKIHLTKEEIAKEFKALTGDDITLAGTKLGGVEMRNLQRDNGNNTTQREPPLYNEYELQLLKEYANFNKKSIYLFHTTSKENISSIIKHGLSPGFAQRFEGVSSPNKIYLSANEATANYYAKQDDVLLRVRKSYVFNDLEEDLLAGGGAYSTGQTIPASSLEIKSNGAWVSLNEYRG